MENNTNLSNFGNPFSRNAEIEQQLAQAKQKFLEPDPEFDNFLNRVDEITEIIHGLASDSSTEQEKALRKADIIIHDKHGGNGDEEFVDDDGSKYKVKSSRTVINPVNENEGKGDMSQAAFMRMVEKDANERAKDRRERKDRSDQFKKVGNIAFRAGNYSEALDYFNKAIELVKDSPSLFNNRALTYLRTGIYSKALEDCDKVLRLDEENFKSHLLKAKAYFLKDEKEACCKWLNETKEKFPTKLKMIDEYEKELYEMRFDDNDNTNNLEKQKVSDTSSQAQVDSGE